MLREEWEKREQLERLQQEQQELLEMEKMKRMEFERMQKKNEQQLQGIKNPKKYIKKHLIVNRINLNFFIYTYSGYMCVSFFNLYFVFS